MYRTYDLARNILKSNFATRPAYPYKLTYAVTYRCNQKCRTCEIWNKNSANEMSLAEIEKFFKVSNQFNWIDLTGGEVSLRKDIVDIARVILENCRGLYLLHFPSNGFLTDRIVGICREIIALRPKRFIVSISLDGPPQLHDELRGTRGSFEKSIATFSELKKLCSPAFDVFFGTTLSPYNYDRFHELTDAVMERMPGVGFKDFHINIAHESPHYYSNKVSMDGCADPVIDLVSDFQRRRGRVKSPVAWLEAAYLSRVAAYLKTHQTPVDCHSLLSSCFIAPDGEVFPCSMFNSPIGALREVDYDLSTLWNSDIALKIYGKIKQKQCPHCWTPCEAYQSILGNVFKRGG